MINLHKQQGRLFNSGIKQVQPILKQAMKKLSLTESGEGKQTEPNQNSEPIAYSDGTIGDIYARMTGDVLPNYFQKKVVINMPIWAVAGQNFYSFSTTGGVNIVSLWTQVSLNAFWTSTVMDGTLPNFELCRLRSVNFEYMADNTYDTTVGTVLPYMGVAYYPTYTAIGLPLLQGFNAIESGSVMRITPGISNNQSKTWTMPQDNGFGTSLGATSNPFSWLNVTQANATTTNAPGVFFLVTPSLSVNTSGSTFQVGNILITVDLEIARSIK